MDVLEAIKKRRSVREYLPGEIPAEILIKLVESASMAPSGRGEYPWEFIIVRDKKNLKKLSRIVEKNAPFLKNASACILVISKPTKYYLEDCSAATQNLLLAATSYGVGSCWIAGDKKEYLPEIKKLFSVPEEFKLVSLVSLGYPAREKSKPKNRRKLKEILHWEKF